MEAASKIQGRTYDLKKWFCQMAVSKAELWKCGIHVSGGFREDRRMQMGRTSSAHSAQRVSMLIVHLLQRAALLEEWGLKGDKNGDDKKLGEWINNRQTHFPDDALQAQTVSFAVYQDDMTLNAIGRKAAQGAEEGIPRICKGRYDIKFCEKEEADRPFAQTFSSIGPLELLGSAIAVDVGAKTGALHGKDSIVLRNDNESACTVINSGKASSAPMLEALRIFTKVRERLGLTIRMHHIKGANNAIADYLSRERDGKLHATILDSQWGTYNTKFEYFACLQRRIYFY